MRNVKSMLAGAMLLATLGGCATAPSGDGAKNDLINYSDEWLRKMYVEDKTLKPYLENAAGFAVYPEVGRGGLVVGGGYGKGVLYVGGKAVGYSSVTRLSVGATAGGESLSEVVVINTKAALLDFMDGDFTVSANAHAVAIKDGAAADAVKNDLVVFVRSKDGAMIDASIGGQEFRYEPIK